MSSTPLLPQSEFWKPITEVHGAYASIITTDTTGNIFVVTDRGLFRSQDEGQTWQSAHLGLPEFVYEEASPVSALITSANGDIFAGTLENGVYRSSDKGESWSFIGLENHRVFSLAANRKGHVLASVSLDGIMRSIDNGVHWVPVDSSGWYVQRPVLGLFVDPEDYIYAAAFDVVSAAGSLFRSTDDGMTWVETGLHYLVTHAMSFKADGTIFAGTSQPVLPPREDESGIYHSTDHGDHWTRLTTELTGSKQNIAFSIAMNSRGHIYAGGYSLGVFRSFDDGKSWEQINSGLSNLSISALAFSRDGYLFAGTRGGGAFRSIEPTTSVQGASGELPRSYSLGQNFPNPANTDTGFRFYLPRSGYVRIKIYNIVGEEVVTLTETFVPAGGHFVQFRTDNLANGVYLLRMETREFGATRKVLIIR